MYTQCGVIYNRDNQNRCICTCIHTNDKTTCMFSLLSGFLLQKISNFHFSDHTLVYYDLSVLDTGD